MHLKACNHFKLYNGKAAEQELKTLQEQASSSFSFGQDLIQHNLVVFRNGEGALQTLPPLVDVIPEARLNLVIYLLKQDDIAEAYALIKDLEPTVPQEYILKGKIIFRFMWYYYQHENSRAQCVFSYAFQKEWLTPPLAKKTDRGSI